MFRVLADALPEWGGQTFIQLITGINFAFFSFEQLNARRNYAGSRAREIIYARFLSIKDSDRFKSWEGIIEKVLGVARYYHDLIWEIGQGVAIPRGSYRTMAALS